jgi:hypothetical protein
MNSSPSVRYLVARIVWGVVMALLLLPAALFSQGYFFTVQLTDPSGAIVQGA